MECYYWFGFLHIKTLAAAIYEKCAYLPFLYLSKHSTTELCLSSQLRHGLPKRSSLYKCIPFVINCLNKGYMCRYNTANNKLTVGLRVDDLGKA